MKTLHKNLLLLAIAGFFSFTAISQQNYWSRHTETGTLAKNKAVTRQSFPTNFKLFDLSLEPLRQQLMAVTDNGSRTAAIISLPNAAGDTEQFEVWEASNFEPALQAQYPEIRAFSGRGVTDRYATLKLSISPRGIQTLVFRTDKSNELIEPYSLDNRVYAVFISHRKKGELPWVCTTEDRATHTDIGNQLPAGSFTESSTGELKTMRLAQSVTAEYSNYFGATSAAQSALVLAAVNASLTRCNGCYEKDLGLHLNLIANTANVFYYNPITDPYSDAATGAGGAWNGELQSTLTSVIGEANYDIGHLFGASGGGGNAGCIGCVCVNGQKGSGYTSPADGIPEGDNFDIDYVTHEIGHQLGANHTFSYANEATGVNKEVGSGITIMGYAGITPQDVAPHSIDIYHQASIAQIQANLAGKACPTNLVMTANTPPVVAAVSNYTIPISTPFALTGSATDAQNDPLTYCWEQNDNSITTGANSVASPTKLTGPNWLTFPATVSGTRTFPQLSTILDGLFVTPPLPGGDAGANIEALSSVARTLNFRLTVRDNHPYIPGSTIGQTQFTNSTVTVSALSGPFQVTSPNTAVVWAGGSAQNITWSVANTTAAPVSCANVKISLSTDGGQTFPTVLAAGTPNDGTHSVTIPSLPNTSSTCRIKVEAVGNIFFDISNTNFTITAPDIQFEFSGDTQREATVTTTACRSYKDYTVNMKSSQVLGGTGNALVTLNVAPASTATQSVDFDFTTNGSFTTPSNIITFTAGGAVLQPFTIRIYDDASVETVESFVLTYTLAAGTTTAVTGTENQAYTFAIKDNDIVPHGPATPNATIGSGGVQITQPFRGEYNDSRTQILYTAAELQAAGFYDGSISNITELAFNITAKASTIPYAGFTIKLKNTTSTALNGDAAFEAGATTVYGPVSYSTVAGVNNFVLTTPFAWDSTQNLLVEICYNNANGGGGRSAADAVASTLTTGDSYIQYDRSTTNGVTGCTIALPAFITNARPDITLKQQAVVQTPVETVASSTKTVYLGPNADIYVYSTADNELIARVQNLSSFDYGCTNITVDRDGSSSVQFWNSNPSNYLLSKSIRIVPTDNSVTGHYKLTLYYTTGEVSGWQTATGQTFTNTQMVKVSNGFYVPDVTPAVTHIEDVTIAPATTGTIGTHRYITSEFLNTGLSGFGAGYPCGPLATTVIWTGAINTDWSNPGNWACGAVPGPTSNVQITSGLLNYPVLATNTTINSLTLRPGGTYQVNTGITLTLLSL